MKLTVVVAVCLVLCLNYKLGRSQPLKRIESINRNFVAHSDKIQARQAYPAEDYYYDEEEDEEEEDELQQSLYEQNYGDSAGSQGEGYVGQESEEEDDNEEDEADEESEAYDEERFMENNAFLTKIFDIL